MCFIRPLGGLPHRFDIGRSGPSQRNLGSSSFHFTVIGVVRLRLYGKYPNRLSFCPQDPRHVGSFYIETDMDKHRRCGDSTLVVEFSLHLFYLFQSFSFSVGKWIRKKRLINKKVITVIHNQIGDKRTKWYNTSTIQTRFLMIFLSRY